MKTSMVILVIYSYSKRYVQKLLVNWHPEAEVCSAPSVLLVWREGCLKFLTAPIDGAHCDVLALQRIYLIEGSGSASK